MIAEARTAATISHPLCADVGRVGPAITAATMTICCGYAWLTSIRDTYTLTGMAQVTVYLPDRVAMAVKQRAKRAGKSLSAWLAELLEREAVTRKWPRSLLDVLDHGRGDLIVPDDPPAEDPEPLR